MRKTLKVLGSVPISSYVLSFSMVWLLLSATGQVCHAQASTQSDSLEFESRYALYKHLQNALEEFFDRSDASADRQLRELAQFVAENYGDDFYVRQLNKFRTWMINREVQSLRSGMKLAVVYVNNREDQFRGESLDDEKFEDLEDYSEVGERFLSMGDTAAAANCMLHAASFSAKRFRAEQSQEETGKAIDLSRRVGDLDGLARAYNFMGMIQGQQARYLIAGAYFDSARVIRTKLDDRAGLAECLNNISAAYLALGDKVRALEFSREALQTRRELGDREQHLQSLFNICSAFASDVALADVQSWLHEIDSLTMSLHKTAYQDRRLFCHSILATREGDIERALGGYEELLERLQRSGDARLRLSVLQNAASAYSSLGAFDEALAAYAESRELAVAIGSRAAEASVYHNIGALYQRLGNLEKARDYYERAGTLRERLKLYAPMVLTMVNLAQLYLQANDFAMAAEYSQRAVEAAKSTNDSRRLSEALRVQAQIEQASGKQSQAMKTLETAESVLGDKISIQDRIDLAVLGTDFSRRAGQLGESSKELAKSFLLLDSCDTYSNRQRIEMLSALVSFDQKKWLEAKDQLSAVIARAENVRRRIPDLQLRSSYQSNSRQAYEMMVRALVEIRSSINEPKWNDSLLIYFEKAKARGTLDAMQRRSNLQSGSRADSLAKQEQMVLRRIDDAESKIPQVEDKATIARLLANLDSLDSRLSDIRLQQSAIESAQSSIFLPTPIAVSKLQAQLNDDNTLLLSYLLTTEGSYAICIDRSSCKVVNLPGREQITHAVSEFSSLVQHSIKDESLLDSLSIHESNLAEMLVPGSAFDPSRYKRLIISPDGILSVLPFEALRIRDKFLIEYCSVSRLPSLFLFAGNLTEETPAYGRLLAISDPKPAAKLNELPYSVREVEWITEAIGKNRCTILSGAEATKGKLLKALRGNYSIVHAATHSTINYEDPSRSKIWLSADSSSKSSESCLMLNDIENLRINANLVVLSSCESGGGRIDVGEGMDGFVKTFMEAGAGNVIVSLWEVEDFASAAFMKSFYEHLDKGYAEALRQAKLQMIKSNRVKHRHPYYWSPFVLTIGGEESSSAQR